MATIDNLSIEISGSADRLTASLDRLESVLGRLATAADRVHTAAENAGGGMDNAADGARDMEDATHGAEEQVQRAVPRLQRFWNALRGVGSQLRGGFVRAIHSGADALGTFTKSLARIAFYRSIRAIIKDMGQSFRDLYGYSRMFGTDFSKSMDRITTASVYLRNSFAAMVAPLVNLFAPALDMIADKIVDIMNFVNQLFAAINGQETYTVAKKVATTWESTFDSAAKHVNKKIKEVRNTILGFDEINRLNGATPTSSGGSGSSPYTPGYSTMFEEKPLEGFFKKISSFTSGMPDWLKWLLGGTTLIGGFLLIRKFIPWLLKKIGELFAFKIPDWLRWLFGPKGDGDGGFDLPKEIDLPDVDLPVDIVEGDWDVLDSLDDPVSKTVNVSLSKGAWDKTAWLGANMTDFDIFRNIYVAVEKKKGAWNNTAWLAANMTKYNVTRTVIVEVKQGDEWDKTAWLAANMTKYNVDRTVTVSVIKNTKNWDATAWLGANMTRNNADRTVSVSVNKKKGEWDATAWLGANMTRFDIQRNIIVSVNKSKGSWDATAWLGANMTRFDILRNIIVSVSKKSGGWDSTAWLGANMTKYDIPRDVIVSVSKKNGAWDATAWLGANMTKFDIPRNIIVSVNKKNGEWDNTAWLGANMTKFDIPRNIIVSVSKKIGEWNADAWKAANMTSNSVTTTVSVKMKENTTEPESKSVWDVWWGIFNKTLSIEQEILMKLVKGWNKPTPQEEVGVSGLSSDINMTLTQGWTGTPQAVVGTEDLDSNITMYLEKYNEWKNNNDGALGILDLVGLSTNIQAKLTKTKTWREEGVLKALNLDDVTATIKVKLAKTANNKVEYYFNGGGTDANVKVGELFRRGGAIVHGRRTNIPQYAGGTLNAHGSLFLAGEAGPEIVGHVGGRTEVLNKSQLASAMFSAVRAALAPAAANFAYAAQAMGTTSSSEPNYAGLYEIIRDAMGNALANDNGNRERNQLLREINDKEMDVEVSTSSINRAQTRMNRRAGTTIVAVGT